MDNFLIKSVRLCLVLNLFLVRPAALGQTYTSLAMGLAVLLALTYLIVRPPNLKQQRPDLAAHVGFVAVLFVIYWTYESLIALISGQTNPEFATKEFLSCAVIGIAYGLVLIDEDSNRRFFTLLATVVSLSGWSCLATTLLAFLIGGLDPLHITTIHIEGYSGNTLDPNPLDEIFSNGAIYFPFSMVYGRFTSGDLLLTRFNGFFREAGIFQAFALFCFVYEYYGRRSVLVLGGLVAATIFSLSTVGALLLVTTIGLMYSLRQGITMRAFVAAICIAGLGWFVLMYTPYIGLQDKLTTHLVSGTDRTDAITRSLSRSMVNPLGTGPYSGVDKHDGVSLFASLSQIGLIGFFCQLLILSGWRWRSATRIRELLMYYPLLITGLFFQPLAGAAFMYVVAMAWLSDRPRQSQ